ncbi:MAG: hypothetical protein ACK5XS_01110 [Armatimonadota bacterium]|jgi:hypothetical protein|nr:hypothetical protein [Fimbriimonadaceae bacterium]
MSFLELESSGGIFLVGVLTTILVMTGMAILGTKIGITQRVSYYFREMTHLGHLSALVFFAAALFFPWQFPHQALLAGLVFAYGLVRISLDDAKNWKHDKEQSLIPHDQLEKLSERGRNWPNRMFLFGTDRERVRRLKNYHLRLDAIAKRLEDEFVYYEQEPGKYLCLISTDLAAVSTQAIVWKDRVLYDQLRPYFLNRPLIPDEGLEFLERHGSPELFKEVMAAAEEGRKLALLFRCHEGR